MSFDKFLAKNYFGQLKAVMDYELRSHNVSSDNLAKGTFYMNNNLGSKASWANNQSTCQFVRLYKSKRVAIEAYVALQDSGYYGYYDEQENYVVMTVFTEDKKDSNVAYIKYSIKINASKFSAYLDKTLDENGVFNEVVDEKLAD